MKKEYDFKKGKRGAIEQLPRGKTLVTIPLDKEILDWFRAQVHAGGGGNYLVLMNRVLREYIEQRQEPLEDILRRVVREELNQHA